MGLVLLMPNIICGTCFDDLTFEGHLPEHCLMGIKGTVRCNQDGRLSTPINIVLKKHLFSDGPCFINAKYHLWHML